MTKTCQCEHADHEYACSGAPVEVKATDYGLYAVCQECVDAGHLSAFPTVERVQAGLTHAEADRRGDINSIAGAFVDDDNHGYPVNNADRMDHDGAEDLADMRESGPFCRGCGANLRIEGHLSDCENLPDQDAIEAADEPCDCQWCVPQVTCYLCGGRRDVSSSGAFFWWPADSTDEPSLMECEPAAPGDVCCGLSGSPIDRRAVRSRRCP